MSKLTNYTFAETSREASETVRIQWQDWESPDSDKKDLRQAKVAYFIATFWQANKYGPTLREIQKEVEIASLTTIREDLEILANDGLVTYVPKQARTLVPTDKLLLQL